MSGRPGGGVLAALLCSACRSTFSFPVRGDATPHAIDAKFRAARWKLDPHICPDCQRAAAAKKDAPMSKESADTIKAKGLMFTLLSEHFDGDKGAYDKDWNDKMVADRTGLAVGVVAEHRRICYGEIKEPAELRALRDDIAKLEATAQELAGSIAQEIATLRARVAAVSKQFAV